MEEEREGGREGWEELYINTQNACVPFKLSLFLIDHKSKSKCFHYINLIRIRLCVEGLLSHPPV